MPRKILIGFGVDVDAVAGWQVRPNRAFPARTDGFPPGSAPTEAKTRLWTYPEWVHHA